MHCAKTKYNDAFSTLEAAQAFCLQKGNAHCNAVYDEKCDGKGTFYACRVATFQSSSVGSCIHKGQWGVVLAGLPVYL